MHDFTLLFLIFLSLSVGIEIWLSMRQKRHVLLHRGTVPEAFKDRVSLEEHQKAADYTMSKGSVGRIELLYGTLILLGWTLGGGLELLDNFWRSFEWSPVLTGIGVFLSLIIISSLLDLPFNLYRTFVIEERFGFNRINWKTYISDKIKGAVLLAVIGIPLFWIILTLLESAGSNAWFYVWLVWSGFMLFMIWAYPTLIAPLFNKFTPLEDASLKARIEGLLSRCGFTSQGLFVMDGSKRSGHGNAYFTGFGQNKRIVFFDTLLDGLSPDEVEAVLAHELGHFRHHHVKIRLAISLVTSLLGLALLGWIMHQPWFYTGLGVSQPSTYMALLLFVMAGPVFSFFLGPLSAILSRRHEYQADEFAAKQTNAQALIQALVKMYRENAATLTPDPLHSSFHDSHPPAPLRIAHLEAK